MSKNFVQLHGAKIKRVTNKFGGEGWNDTDPMATIRRRHERRQSERELASLLAEDGALETNFGDFGSGVSNGSRIGMAESDDKFYQPSEGRLRLVRDSDTGMLTFASYGNSDHYHGRRRRNHW